MDTNHYLTCPKCLKPTTAFVTGSARGPNGDPQVVVTGTSLWCAHCDAGSWAERWLWRRKSE